MYRPMMVAAAKALQNPKSWHDEMNAVYAKRRILALAIMDVLGCKYDTKQVGMFIWAKIPDNYRDSGELADEVLYGKNVFITPGFIFGDKGKRYIRISLCSPEDMLTEALHRIKQSQQ
jgi:aspartate/methionine/tyrosine aminotransferase